jgi:hypothetical protein
MNKTKQDVVITSLNKKLKITNQPYLQLKSKYKQKNHH